MAVKLSPVFNGQEVDANGAPAVGYKLFTYAAGSSTKQTTYTDSTGAVQQTNPIILNSLGYPTNGPIWLTAGQNYKFVLAPSTDADPPTSPIKTIDGVTGVNDSATSVTQFQSSGVTPTYISSTSFSLVGDQTSDFHVGRRVQATVNSGTVYGTIATTAYTTITTVTLTMDGSQVLDSGISAVNLSLLKADHLATPFANVAETIAGVKTFTSSPVVPDATLPNEPATKGQVDSAVSAVPTVRQTVLSGPVDSSGLSAFGGSTGSTTVTAAGAITATAANGVNNRTGSITNPSWMGLSTNGTMYLYLDIAADGTCTTGSTTLAPAYQWGGTYSTTNNQFTFNIQEMTGKVGNGSTATQTYRVFVGEVTVAGGVVTAIVWYALMGRYDSGLVATLPGTSTFSNKDHNIGLKIGLVPQLWLECISTELSYAVGDRTYNIAGTNGSYSLPLTVSITEKVVGFGTANGQAINIQAKNGGTNLPPTAAKWKYGFTVKRDW